MSSPSLSPFPLLPTHLLPKRLSALPLLVSSIHGVGEIPLVAEPEPSLASGETSPDELEEMLVLSVGEGGDVLDGCGERKKEEVGGQVDGLVEEGLRG